MFALTVAKVHCFALMTWQAVAQAETRELIFKSHGVLVKKMDLDSLEATAPSQYQPVYEVHESKNLNYKAYHFTKVLDAAYGAAWHRAEEILFTCTDGYQPSVPRMRFEQHQSFLAFERQGSERFEVINHLKNDEKVPLGPFYLVWENLKDAEVRADGATDWPYQVVAVDLVSFNERFPGIAPGAKSSATAQRGFLSFRKYCLSCHLINGEGGGKAPELNYPVNITEYFREDWLRKWIDRPQALRAGTTMPGLGLEIKNREAVIGDLIAYLRAMKLQKHEPKAKKN